MRKIITAVMLLFTAVIVFFTFYGEKLYYATKPQVTLSDIETAWGELYLPESAVYEENDEKYVYTVESEGGFSMTIMRARRYKLKECESSEMYQGYVRIVFEENVRERRFITASTKELGDGVRIVLAEK